MNTATFLSILKNFFKGLNEANSDVRQAHISYDDEGTGTHSPSYDYNLISKIFSVVRKSNVYSESGEKTSFDKYLKNKYYEKLGIQTTTNKKVEDDKVNITYGSDTKINN